MSTPKMPSSWLRMTLSITEPSSLYVVDFTLPRRITNDSSLSGCLWIGTSVPGSNAFNRQVASTFDFGVFSESTFYGFFHLGFYENCSSFSTEGKPSLAYPPRSAVEYLLSRYVSYYWFWKIKHLSEKQYFNS